MNIGLLLEVFEDRFKTLEELGIKVRITRDNLTYSFYDTVRTRDNRTKNVKYLVTCVLTPLPDIFGYMDFHLDANDRVLLAPYLHAYITLEADGSVEPTNAGNSKVVYSSMLACILDAFKTKNVKAFGFTPYNSQMELVYYSFIKMINRHYKQDRIIQMSEVGQIDVAVLRKLSKQAQQQLSSLIISKEDSEAILKNVKKDVASSKRIDRIMPILRNKFMYEFVKNAGTHFVIQMHNIGGHIAFKCVAETTSITRFEIDINDIDGLEILSYDKVSPIHINSINRFITENPAPTSRNPDIVKKFENVRDKIRKLTSRRMDEAVLLEVFDDKEKSIDDLGISVSTENSNYSSSKTIWYRFSDYIDGEHVYYSVKVECEPLSEVFENDLWIRITDEETEMLKSIYRGYITLSANGDVRPTRANNQRLVYNALLACVNDALYNQNVKAIEFTPFNDKMHLVYNSFIKMANRTNPGGLIKIRSLGYVDPKVLKMLSNTTYDEVTQRTVTQKELDSDANEAKQRINREKQMRRMLPEIKEKYAGEFVDSSVLGLVFILDIGVLTDSVVLKYLNSYGDVNSTYYKWDFLLKWEVLNPLEIPAVDVQEMLKQAYADVKARVAPFAPDSGMLPYKVAENVVKYFDAIRTKNAI